MHWVAAGARTHITELLTAFGAAEASISRTREFRADRLGASVATAEDIGFSLTEDVGGQLFLFGRNGNDDGAGPDGALLTKFPIRRLLIRLLSSVSKH